MKLSVTRPGLEFYVKRLEQAEPYSFIRFGNGEWDCIFNRAVRTGSGSQSLKSSSLKAGMRRAMDYNDSSYFRAIQSPSYMKRQGLTPLILRAYPSVIWHHGEVFHYASKRAELKPLINQLRKLRVGFIGPRHLRRLNRFIDYEWFVEVSKRDCFSDYAEIRTEILKQNVVDVYSFSAGPAAKLLIYELHQCLRGRSTLIDFGSMWDPYCGVNSRHYHRRITEQVIKENMNV